MVEGGQHRVDGTDEGRATLILITFYEAVSDPCEVSLSRTARSTV